MSKPLTEYTEQELHTAYEKVARNAEPGLAMLQDEVSRRTNEKTARAVERLTLVILGLTAALFVLGAVQLTVALRTSSGSAAFVLLDDPSYYCSDPATAATGPCTITAIFRSTGGLGTKVAVFTESGGQMCRAVIPSTPADSEAEASCVVPGFVSSGEKPRVRVEGG